MQGTFNCLPRPGRTSILQPADDEEEQELVAGKEIDVARDVGDPIRVDAIGAAAITTLCAGLPFLPNNLLDSD